MIELEQASAELKKAIIRARTRLERVASPPLLPSHFNDIIKAMDFANTSLQTLCDAHPGDSETDLSQLVQERASFSGWEIWSSLLDQQLSAATVEAASLEDNIEPKAA